MTAAELQAIKDRVQDRSSTLALLGMRYGNVSASKFWDDHVNLIGEVERLHKYLGDVDAATRFGSRNDRP